MSGGYTHVLREVDTGDEHSLRYPGRTLVGRARVNDIQPNHGSVSKQHAVVELTGDPGELFTTATVEDLHTRNGTYTGHPDRMNTINGKRPLKMGEYIKFGDCKNLYIFEALRNPDQPVRTEDPMSPLRSDERGDNVLEQRDIGFSRAGSQAVTVADSIGGPRVTQHGSSMNISINYPADPGAQRQAVSIQIDPRSEAPVAIQAPSVLSPSRVSFGDGIGSAQQLSMSPSRSVNGLGELDLSGDFGNSSRRSTHAVERYSGVGRDQDRFIGTASIDAQPRKGAPPSPAIKPSTASMPITSSNGGTRQMSPLTVLTEKERDDAEKLRQSLADGIRVTNQVLAGVLRFDEWKIHAKKIIGDSQLAVQLPVDTAYVEKGITAEFKAAQDLSATNSKNTLLKEVFRELAAERPLPLEATMTGRLSSALEALRSLPMLSQDQPGVRLQGSGGPSVHNILSRAEDDILGAVETPLGMALEGTDLVLSEELGRKSATAGDSRKLALNNGGKIGNLRNAVAKLKGLDFFYDSMGSESTQPIVASLNQQTADDLNWWKGTADDTHINGTQSHSNLADLIKSVELEGPGEIFDGIAPASALSREQLEQIAKYVVLNVIEEDIQPVLDRIAKEKTKSRTSVNDAFDEDDPFDIQNSPRKGMRSPAIKHSDLADMEKSLDQLSRSFGEKPKKNKSKCVTVDLEGVLAADGELRLSSSGNRVDSGLNLSKLPPPGKGKFSPRSSYDKHGKARSLSAMSAEGSLGDQSPRDNLSLAMSQEHIEQLTAVNDELELLEKKHKEEMDRLAAEAEADKLRMQSRSEQERREIEDSRRREKEMLEAEMAGQRNALMQEKQRVLEEAEQAHQTMVKYVTYKVITKMLNLYRVKVQSAFKRWAFMTMSFNTNRSANKNQKKQLKRLVYVVCSGELRSLHRAFRKWNNNCLRDALTRSRSTYLGSQRELLRLREQCKAANEDLRDIAKGSDLYASLLAEKALNRELTSSNIQLFDSLNEAQLQVLEMAKIPTSEGKKLVRDVIISREGELARSRREVRALKERVEHLEGTFSGMRSAAADAGRDFMSSSTQSKYRGGAVQGGLEVPGFMSSFMDPDGRKEKHSDSRMTNEAIDYLAPIDEKKKQALSIILMELTRLRKVNAEFIGSKKYLSELISKHLAKISDMEVVSHVLQQRLSDKIRREASILSYLERSLDADSLRQFNRFMAEMDGQPTGGDSSRNDDTTVSKIPNDIGYLRKYSAPYNEHDFVVNRERLSAADDSSRYRPESDERTKRGARSSSKTSKMAKKKIRQISKSQSEDEGTQ